MSYLVWLAATRTAKLLPHLWTRPQDIIYVPAFILFGYYFAIMKIYALLTLHEVSTLVFVDYIRNFTHLCRRPAGVLALVSATHLKLWQRLPQTKNWRKSRSSNMNDLSRRHWLGTSCERPHVVSTVAIDT